MKNIKITILLTFLTIFFCKLNAVTIDETARIILYGSPSYKLGESGVLAEKENLKTESNLPDPQLDGEFLAAPVGETDRWGAELSWGLEWPGVYGARKKEADMKIQTSRKRLEAQRLEQLASIKSLLLDYILAFNKLQILKELDSRNDSIYEFAEISAKSGQMTVLDLNKVKLENANIRAAMAGVSGEMAQIISEISQEYGNDCLPILVKMDCEFPPVDIPQSLNIDKLLSSSPELLALNAESEAVRLGKKVATMEALPSLSIGYKHAYEDGIHFNGATLGVSIPMFSSRNKQKAAKADIMESELKTDAFQQRVKVELEALLNRLSIMKEQIEAIEPLLSDTNHSEMLVKAYENGLISLIDYLTERNYYTNATIELFNLKHSAAMDMVKLQKFTNTLD